MAPYLRQSVILKNAVNLGALSHIFDQHKYSLELQNLGKCH
jgi:hypothetical protein